MGNIRSQRTLALLLTASIVLVALNLRPSMASIGPLLSLIRQDIPLSFASASLLTMVPVTAMGLAMLFGVKLTRSMNEHSAIAGSLVIIGLATFSRLWVNSSAELILSAVVAGVGIATIQARMPSIIKNRFPDSLSFYMGLYVTAIMAGAALSAGFSPTIAAQAGGWRSGLAIWALLAAAALSGWLTWRNSLGVLPKGPGAAGPNHLRNCRSWLLAVFFGLGTASYTCVLAWLAPYYVESGWSEQNAGLMLGFLTCVEVISGLVVPALANLSKDRRLVLILLLLSIIGGFSGLVMAPHSFRLLWPMLLGVGIGGLFPMSLVVSMDHLDIPSQAGALTAFVQGIGYLIAGLSPLLAGIIRDQLQSFAWAWWALAGVSALMLMVAVRFDPAGYARRYSS